MFFEADRQTFVEALERVAPATKTLRDGMVMPVLSRLLLEVEEGRVRMTATDLDVTASVTTVADVEAPGRVAPHSDALLSALAKAKGERFRLQCDDEALAWVQVECDGVQFRVIGTCADDYPRVPSADGSGVTIPGEVLQTALTSVDFACAAVSQHQPLYEGVRLQFTDGHLIATATDGVRAAWWRSDLTVDDADLTPFVLQRAHAKLIAAHLDPDEPVDIWTDDDDMLVVRQGVWSVHARYMTGSFPDVLNGRRDDCSTMVFDRAELRRALNLVRLFEDRLRIMSLIVGEGAVVQGQGDLGTGARRVAVEYDGEPIQFSLNGGFFRDAVAAVGSDQVAIEVTGPERPMYIRAADAESPVYPLMPMAEGAANG